MRNILFILIAAVVFASCGSKTNSNTQRAATTEQKEYVEVLYFHGKQRCVTCNAIEKLTKEVLEGDFVEQLKNGNVIFKIVDISTEEGEKIADKYEVTWSSLFINKWKDGKEVRNNMTDFGFSTAKNTPDEFKAGVKSKMDEMIAKSVKSE